MTHTKRASWVDELVPPDLPESLERLTKARLILDGASATPGPADLVVASLVSRYLSSPSAGKSLVLAIPRGRQQLATFVGFYVQVLRAHAWEKDLGRSILGFTGPTVVIGTDSAVQRRLREARIRGATFKGGLAQAISACRVRADGKIVDHQDQILDYEGGGRRLLYLNSRVGTPDLSISDGVAIIDRTTLSDRAYEAAMQWLRANRISYSVIITFLGDELPDTGNGDPGRSSHQVFPLTHSVLSDIEYALGRGDDALALSTNALLGWKPDWHIHTVAAGHVDQLVAETFAALSAAREISDRPPYLIRIASELVATLIRCPVPIDDYSRAAAMDPYIQSPRSLYLTLKNQGNRRLGDEWRGFEQLYWSGLRNNALRLYETLDEKNPKGDAIVDAADKLRRTEPTARIVIRVPSHLQVTLVEQHLQDAGVIDGRMLVAPWSTRYEWRSADAELWTGSPSWRHRGFIYSAESDAKTAVCYPTEARILAHRSRQLRHDVRTASQAFAQFLQGLPLDGDDGFGSALSAPSEQAAPVINTAVDLDRIAVSVSALLADQGEAASARDDTTGAEATVELLPVRLDSKGTWWLRQDAAVGVLVGGNYRHRLAVELRAGDQVIVPRGEGRDEILGRMLAARHATGDVAELDLLLGRFRAGCRKLLDDTTRTAVERIMREAGASALTQVPAWADGSTIAPEDPHDVEVVGRLAGDTLLEDSWAAVAAMAAEVRRIHKSLGRLLSAALVEVSTGSGGPSLQRLEKELPDGGIEVLDEFMVAEVVSVGTVTSQSVTMDGVVEKGAAC